MPACPAIAVTYPLGPSARAAVRPSPVFLGVLTLAAIGGALSWQAGDQGVTSAGTKFWVFLFVMAAWVVTLCLHEFAHAFGAWLSGDHEVQARGYLTLNPLKYTNPLLSIVLPVVFLALGGIGLPGGAVYLRPHLFRTKLHRALVSLGGPLVNLAFAVVLVVAVRASGSRFDGTDQHPVFWIAVSFLAYLQLMAAVLNLLPLPGLDGYAVIEPYLSPQTQRAAEQFKGYGMLGLFAILQIAAVNSAFFGAIHSLFAISGIPRAVPDAGYFLVKFWTNNR